MVALRNTFNGGTPGTGILTLNSGGGNGDAWTSISGTPTYTATSGVRAVCATLKGNVAGTDSLSWTVTPAGRDLYLRAYYQISVPPFSDEYIAEILDGGGFSIVRLYLTAARRLVVKNNASTTLATVTTAVPLGQWVRVELLAHAGTTSINGSTEVRLYTSADDTTVTSSASASSVNTGTAVPAAVNLLFHGSLDSYLLDDVAVTDDTWPGPSYIPPPPRRPVIMPYAPQRASRY